MLSVFTCSQVLGEQMHHLPNVCVTLIFAMHCLARVYVCVALILATLCLASAYDTSSMSMFQPVRCMGFQSGCITP